LPGNIKNQIVKERVSSEKIMTLQLSGGEINVITLAEMIVQQIYGIFRKRYGNSFKRLWSIN